MDKKNISKDIDFSIKIEEMKKVFRQVKIIGENRYENDAEHSFHIALNAMIFEEYCEFSFDLDKSIKMLLVHDLVEIIAGDTFAYDPKGNGTKKKREKEAMEEIVSETSDELGKLISSLWEEFEEGKTNEAKYANAMDRLQPILANIENNGGSWIEHNVDRKEVLARMEPIKEFSHEIYEDVLSRIDNILII